jgi:hypothetical protein
MQCLWCVKKIVSFHHVYNFPLPNKIRVLIRVFLLGFFFFFFCGMSSGALRTAFVIAFEPNRPPKKSILDHVRHISSFIKFIHSFIHSCFGGDHTLCSNCLSDYPRSPQCGPEPDKQATHPPNYTIP